MFPGVLLAAIALAACSSGDDGDGRVGSTVVKAASGAPFDLAGTSWASCYPDDPAPGESYGHGWSFGQGTATQRHDVFTGSTDCTGATDPGQHFEVTMSFDADGGDRTVAWEGGVAPAGYPDAVTTTGVTFSISGMSFPGGGSTRKGVAYVDDGKSPAWIFITNPGDDPPPLDAAGYPTVLTTMGHVRE